MEVVEVEAVEDRLRPEGGHAVILLRGLTGPPLSARFTLRLIDGEGVESAGTDLFQRVHEPLAVLTTDDGIALSIGPDIADHPALVPESAVEIVFPAAGWRGEFLWPAVAPQVRPKRRNIMTRRAGPQSALREAATGAAIDEDTKAEKDNAPPEPVGLPEWPLTEDGHLPMPAPDVEAPPEADQSPIAAPLPSPLAYPPPAPLPSSGAAPVVAAEKADDGLAPAVPPPRKPIVLTGVPRVTAEGRPKESDPAPIERARTSPAAEVVALPAGSEANVQTAAPKRVPGTPSIDEPAARAASEPRTRRRLGAAGTVALSLVAMLGAQIIAFRTFGVRLERVPPAAPAVVAPVPFSPPAVVADKPSPPSTPPAVVPEKPKSVQPAAPGVYDILAAGSVSPRGISADGISPARALQMAHALQHGPEAGRDRDEAIYWLKRYVLSTAGAEPTRIALTQLGSAYAAPAASGSDFSRAMVVWELAGALGDTVAMCFLAALHEQGLGVVADRTKAGTWYARAAAGGATCARLGVDQVAPR